MRLFNSPMFLEAASATTRRYRGGDPYPPTGQPAPRSYAKRYGRRPADPVETASPGLQMTVVALEPIAAPEFALAA